ncbi:MAG: hypothetical protein HUU16_19130 [Candidatus Omnitrophica bacterium]|nr:hypothetical protein [Candidatus Omnitrophota bacterium]
MLRLNKVLIFTLVLIPGVASAQFDSGSDGSYGPLVVSASDPTPLVLNLPADGIIRATTVSIANSHTLAFNRNALNTPVIILATGDVNINGFIFLSGGNGNTSTGGLGGPGGFNGGSPGAEGVPPGAGYGPGAGLPGDRSVNLTTAAGGAAYGTKPSQNSNVQDGDIYGSPLLIPLIGGSGGGGTDNVGGNPSGGGGGGGALLIASNTKISVASGRGILANGGTGNFGNGGSGGAVRLVAPVVEGNGFIQLYGPGFGGDGGLGRGRIDTLDRTNLGVTFDPPVSGTVGSFMVAIPDVNPRLDIIQVAGQNIPLGSGPVSITLPFGTNPSQNVVVQATDFEGMVDIDVVVTPENGTREIFPATIDATGGGTAQVSVPVQIPLNTGVLIHAWTR